MSVTTLGPASRAPWLSWPVSALLACLAMLGTAHAFEAAGYAPCDLCLRQREVYWAVAGVSLLTAAIEAGRPRSRVTRALGALIALGFVAEAALAAYHAGVEWKWWPGPTHCSGRGGSVSAAQLGALLDGAKVHAVRCDAAAGRMLGLSMAGWNAVVALALGLVGLIMARRTARG